MVKEQGFVVIRNRDGAFYQSKKHFTDELDKAKDFNSKATAERVAKRIKGTVRELYYG